jgi:hypothetical protein
MNLNNQTYKFFDNSNLYNNKLNHYYHKEVPPTHMGADRLPLLLGWHHTYKGKVSLAPKSAKTLKESVRLSIFRDESKTHWNYRLTIPCWISICSAPVWSNMHILHPFASHTYLLSLGYVPSLSGLGHLVACVRGVLLPAQVGMRRDNLNPPDFFPKRYVSQLFHRLLSLRESRPQQYDVKRSLGYELVLWLMWILHLLITSDRTRRSRLGGSHPSWDACLLPAHSLNLLAVWWFLFSCPH